MTRVVAAILVSAVMAVVVGLTSLPRVRSADEPKVIVNSIGMELR